jgi:hypothetical protein
MPLKQHFLTRSRFLVEITLLAYAILPCYQTLGATLSFEFYNSLLEVETSLESDRKNWESVAQEIIDIASQVDAADLFITNFYASASDRSQDNENQKSLSIRSLIDTFRQLNLQGSGSTSQPTNIPILPQVEYANIDKGIYAFETTSKPRNRPINSVFFNADNQTSFPNRSASKVRSIRQLSMPKFDPELSLMPRNNLSTSLEQINVNPAVANVAPTLNGFGGINVNAGFRALPQVSVPTSMKFSNNFVKNSALVRNDLKLLPSLKTEIQQKVNEQAQLQYEQQQERQRMYREKFIEEQERQRQKLHEDMERRKQQQEQQIQQQLERQRQLQQSYQQQMERQLQEYQKMREQFR